MPELDKCNAPGCENEATRIANSATSYIVVCEDCWHDKYRS